MAVSAFRLFIVLAGSSSLAILLLLFLRAVGLGELSLPVSMVAVGGASPELELLSSAASLTLDDIAETVFLDGVVGFGGSLVDGPDSEVSPAALSG